MDAIVNLNKPSGITSQQAVTKVKRLLGARKAGHTGTLDPLATGVLLVCLNEATKISRFLLDADKTYRATVRLGIATDTGDADGRVVEEKDFSFLSAADIAAAAALFSGKIRQKPPMYSAVKVNGEKLYRLARKGIEVEREERIVEIRDIGVSAFASPFFDLTVTCSKGTYIRTLCEDIGRRLGTVAHIVALERTRTGSFTIEDSASFQELSSEDISFGRRYVSSIDDALVGLKELILDANDYDKVRRGIPVPLKDSDSVDDHSCFRLKDPAGRIFGVGRSDFQFLRVERLFNF